MENGPNIGSCETSTYTGKRVVVQNIETDPNWEKSNMWHYPMVCVVVGLNPLKIPLGKY